VRTSRRRGPVTARSAGFGIFSTVLQIDAELAELDDRRSTPADRVGRERQRERHPIRLSERLAFAQIDRDAAYLCELSEARNKAG
jgi:chorismate mutase